MNADLITVVSVRGLKPATAPAALIYIGRLAGGWPRSPLANPYRLSADADRGAVIERYRTWLWGKMQAHDPKVLAELDRIIERVKSGEPVQLGCWCSPLPCHGDVVKVAVLWCENRT